MPKVSEDRTPEMLDRRWEQWSVPVLAYLQTSRTWAELNGWCKAKKFGKSKLRHCLAWLEDQGLARSSGSDEIEWVAVYPFPD